MRGDLIGRANLLRAAILGALLYGLLVVVLSSCASAPTAVARLDYGSCASFVALGDTAVGESVGQGPNPPSFQQQIIPGVVRWTYYDAFTVVFNGRGPECVMTFVKGGR